MKQIVYMYSKMFCTYIPGLGLNVLHIVLKVPCSVSLLQGMRSPVNTHKPSFHVNTSLTSKHNNGKGAASSGQRGGAMPSSSNHEENVTEEEFFEWLQNAVQAGKFDNFSGGTSSENPSAKPGNFSKSGGSNSGSGSGSKRKKKGKKQW